MELMNNSTSSNLCTKLRTDLSKLNAGGTGWMTFMVCLFTRPGFLAVFLYRLSASCLPYGFVGRFFAKFLWRLNVLLCSCDISPRAVIGAGLHLPHPMGVVIGEATLGENVKILQNVALGMRRFTDTDHDPANYPVVGSNVILCAGAVLTGNVKIGHGATIGANAVVTHDVPENATAVGVPARIQ